MTKKWPSVQQHAPTIARRDGGWVCHYCGVALRPYGSNAETGCSITVGGYKYNEYYQSFDVDHVTAKTRGGEHNLSNLVLACITCNTRKGNHDYYDFIDRMSKWLEAYGDRLPRMPIYLEP